MHISVYLITNEDGKNILIDTGTDNGEELVKKIAETTNGSGIDSLILTHSLMPHTSNIGPLRNEWDDINIITAAPLSEIAGLKDAKPKVLNSTEEVSGRRLAFLDPLLTDVFSSNWVYDHESKVLFTSEGFGHYHAPGECAFTSSDYQDGIGFNQISEFYSDKLPYIHKLDPEKLRNGFDAIMAEYDIDYLAPIHGNPVKGDDFDSYMNNVIEVI